MEKSYVRDLLDNISWFNFVSSESVVKSDLVQGYCGAIDEILKLLRPILEEVNTSDIALEEESNKLIEELNVSVKEARELVESWHQMTSKIYFVIQIESVITRTRTSLLETLKTLGSLFQSLELGSVLECIEQSTQKLQQSPYKKASDIIREAMRDQMENITPKSEYIMNIVDSLSLSTNQELLMEIVALDKLKTRIGHGENHGEIEYIDRIIALVSYMHECHVDRYQVHSINDVPIPADFCCPLSLEMMSDPVIVASGQTYERAFIRKWLDQGFTVCPKTRQTLGHTNLIPNYTVKALIANWCETNNIKLPDPAKSLNLNNHDSNITGRTKTSHPRSPESNRYANGLHQESHSNDKTGSSLWVADGSETNVSRLSLASTEGKVSGLEKQHFDSVNRMPNQSKAYSHVAEEDLPSHSRNASASSAADTTDHLQGAGDDNISRVPSDLTHYSSDASGELAREAPASSVPHREPEFVPRLGESRSRNQTIWRRPSDRFGSRIISPSLDARPDLSGVETQVRKLIEDLKSDSVDDQRAATYELRLLAKHSMENRIVIANCGTIAHLVSLLHSSDQKTQENAVTALLNLSINDNNKMAIAHADAIDPLIHVLKTGSPEAKENSAATLFSLSVMEENKARIGRSGAITPLVELLGNGTPRGKKDAATALFNLSIYHENKARIVQAGAVKHLVELMDPAAGMVDKAVAVLANLATIHEGRSAIGHEGGIPVLVEVVELGSSRGKENAAAALLQLCMNSNKFCSMVLQEGAVPPLVALSQSGTPRAKEKAQSLLSHFRNQRHGNSGRG